MAISIMEKVVVRFTLFLKAEFNLQMQQNSD